MTSVEYLASLLGLPLEYLVNTYVGCKSPKFYQLLSKGTFSFAETIDIINAEGNREYATGQAKLIQNKLRSNDVFCGSHGYLTVR